MYKYTQQDRYTSNRLSTFHICIAFHRHSLFYLHTFTFT